jgi:hypothetical protein
MSTIQQLMVIVKEKDLSKEQLESYYTDLSNLKARLNQDFAQLKKEEAMFLVNRNEGESVASVKIRWNSTESGQKKIGIEWDIKTIATLLDSVKTRIYSLL